MTEEQLTEMIQALVAERDELAARANQRIAYLNGKIELARELLDGLNTAPGDDGEAG